MITFLGEPPPDPPGMKPIMRECRGAFHEGILRYKTERSRNQSQVGNLGLLATPFGKALHAFALTCDGLRSLWSRSNVCLEMGFSRLACSCKSARTPKASLHASSTCRYLRVRLARGLGCSTS